MPTSTSCNENNEEVGIRLCRLNESRIWELTLAIHSYFKSTYTVDQQARSMHCSTHTCSNYSVTTTQVNQLVQAMLPACEDHSVRGGPADCVVFAVCQPKKISQRSSLYYMDTIGSLLIVFIRLHEFFLKRISIKNILYRMWQLHVLSISACDLVWQPFEIGVSSRVASIAVDKHDQQSVFTAKPSRSLAAWAQNKSTSCGYYQESLELETKLSTCMYTCTCTCILLTIGLHNNLHMYGHRRQQRGVGRGWNCPGWWLAGQCLLVV